MDAEAQGRSDGGSEDRSARSSAPLRPSGPASLFHDVIVIGGGCYGSFYARQLVEARARGKAGFERLLVVDRDPHCAAAAAFAGVPGLEVVRAEWSGFLDGYLDTAPAGELDVVIPSPLMPHLFFDWLTRRAAARWPDRSVSSPPLPHPVGTPYERRGGDGSSYLSFADWTCPTHCTEPALCPVIRAPRTWEMGGALEAWCRAGGVAGPALFTVRHLVHGVGGFSVAAARAAERMLADAVGPRGGTLLVGTVSSCHGAAALLEVGAPGTAER